MQHQEQREQTQELLQSRGMERALFAHIASVKWLTGFNPPIQTGPSAFQGGPPLVWYEGGNWTLIVMDWQEVSAGEFARQPNCTLVSYTGYTVDQPLTGQVKLRGLFRSVLGNRLSGKIGVELRDAPADIALTLHEIGAAELVPIDTWIEHFRRIKTPEEIQKLRDNYHLTDIGHAAARKAVQKGAREIDVWNAAHYAIEKAAGQRVPLGNDCLVGYRQDNISGWPLNYEIREDDSVIVDLSTILHGYWSDSCAAYYPGEPTAKQRAMHQTAQRALDLAISLVKPGAVARDIDAQVREFMRKEGYPVYPHHTGHSLGVTSHEDPRIVPYNDQVLQENMVIMLEPGIYFPGETSVRLEDAVLVAKDGAEILTHHDKSLP
ncbi:MAG TPA: Xaa-Pro peptidase family protein [Anaerolineae bacterium]|nr:Xaa-Pro peptidase family protein [Anaerolineae bacterium]